MMSVNESALWIGLCETPLPLADAIEWATTPNCGAVVVFSGTVRDFSEGRPGVTSLDYEAYRSGAESRLHEVAQTAQSKWPQIQRTVILHRVGTLSVGESAVIVVIGAPHRAEAFDAARFCIESVKTTVPIWKNETWESGSDWGGDAHELGANKGQTDIVQTR